MPDPEPNDKTNDPADVPEKSPEPLRRTSITPEQRRLLGAARPAKDSSQKEKAATAPSSAEARQAAPPRTPRTPKAPQEVPPAQHSAAEPEKKQERPERANPAAVVTLDQKSSRATEMQRIFLILGAIFVLGLTFYVGKKFTYWKYLLTSRSTPSLAQAPDKFPGVSSDELIKQALALEQSNKWQEAVERFIAAKNKNRSHRGILFHAGKLLLEHRNLDNADAAFERAIAFGEDVDKANYFRGVIAAQRRDRPAAARFFEAAATASPFESEYYYFWGEVLRMDGHPRDAIPRYEQAALRAKSTQEEKVCRFKIRLAQAEAAESMEVNAEVEKKRSEGPLPVDWLMTAAALKIREGHIDDAVRLLSEARNGTDPGLFAACVKDEVFRDASAKHPEVAQVCRLEINLPSTFAK